MNFCAACVYLILFVFFVNGKPENSQIRQESTQALPTASQNKKTNTVNDDRSVVDFMCTFCVSLCLVRFGILWKQADDKRRLGCFIMLVHG
jgi:hypothetical protein